MTKSKQQGGALGTFLLIVFLLMTAIIGMKVFPAYLEFYSVKNTLKTMGESGETRGALRDVRSAFTKRATVADIKNVTADSISVDNGVASAEYSVAVPLFANMKLVIDFAASSAN
jgi:hypothetical protein